ncbi:MAG: VOC family protein [Chloroflexi bacterium]|nr:VOC family protein [Chloroflexota bacterium]
MLLRFNRPVVNVSDIERSLAFYRDKLGMKVVSDNRTTDADKQGTKAVLEKAFNVSNLDLRWVVLEVAGEGAGREVELLQWNNPKPPGLPGSRNCYDSEVAWCAFRVQGLRAFYDKLASQGVKFLAPLAPFNSERGICYALDPDGYIVELGGSLQ